MFEWIIGANSLILYYCPLWLSMFWAGSCVAWVFDLFLVGFTAETVPYEKFMAGMGFLGDWFLFNLALTVFCLVWATVAKWRRKN